MSAPPAEALLVLTAFAAGYLSAVRVRARRGLRPWSPWRAASFLLGVALLGVALAVGTPDVHGHEVRGHDLRGHMVQHLLLGMLAPLALVLGAPLTLLLGAAPVPVRRRLASALGSRVLHVLAHPAAAAVLTVGGLYLLYLTPVYAVSVHEPVLAGLVHVHFVLAGYLFAWSVAGPDPAPRRPGTAVRAVVLVLAGGAHAYLATLLYARAPELPAGGGYRADDVRAAAQWMYYGGDVAEVLLAVALFAGWYRLRRRRQVSGAVRVRPSS